MKIPIFKIKPGTAEDDDFGIKSSNSTFPKDKTPNPHPTLGQNSTVIPHFLSSFFFMAKSGGKGEKKNPSLKNLFQFITPGWGFYGKEIPPWHGCGIKKRGKNDGSCKSLEVWKFPGKFPRISPLTFLWVWGETWELLQEGEGIEIQRDFRDSFRVGSAGKGGGSTHGLGICSLGIFPAHLDRCGSKSCPIQGELESPFGNLHIPWGLGELLLMLREFQGIPGKDSSGILSLSRSALIPSFYPGPGKFFGKRNSIAICSPTLPAGNQKRRIIRQHPMVPIPVDVSTSRNFGKRGTGAHSRCCFLRYL